ncbi:filamentation protein Rhf1 [Aspergillus sp. HF37]|nr:filamentation protein Rhf1 [Aspergillus sp. HF37]
MTGRDSEKGNRYAVALDNARCQDKWDEVPELIRKVTKHSPWMTCFIKTASADSQIAAHIQQIPSTAQPSSQPNLHELIPSLLSAIEKEDGSQQDKFQAQVSLGWVHWTLNEPGLAVGRLPKDFATTIDGLSHDGQELSPWTEACLVKGCYIKGCAQSFATGSNVALDTFSSIIPWLSDRVQKFQSNPDFSSWSEKLLAKAALLAGDEVSQSAALGDSTHMETALKAFRLWSAHPSVKQWVSSHGSHAEGTAEPASKTRMWKSYYDLLTNLVQHDLPYLPPTSGSERPLLANEIRRVESICENNLLREVKFPMANAPSPQVEDWVEQVIQNWEVLCGPHWCDEDLGEGGQNAVGRNVLDILYRSATKTYHSHLILKRLFHVHSALVEFDLALRALDSYIEIVVNAKSRAEKSAQYGELENDGTLIQTVSEGVFMLCCFGAFEEAEKARDLVALLKTYTDKHIQDVPANGEDGMSLVPQNTSSTSSEAVPLPILATAFRAIGVGLANWASWTPVNDVRDDIRSEAIEYLDRSLVPELEDECNFSSLYTLALLLAENRDLDGATECVKLALASNAHHTTAQAILSRERDLVSLWHLLALLLSAKQDFEIAERSCEAAFEQFPSAITSLGQGDGRSPNPAQNEKNQYDTTDVRHALFGQLKGREKERIVETRMTQLAFVELSEGPEAAVNRSEQLLGLFAALFPELDLDDGRSKTTKAGEHLAPPKSSAGTVRSLRGSIFSRNRGSRTPERKPEATGGHNPSSQHPSDGQKENINSVDAPATQATDRENEGPIAEHQRLPRRGGSVKEPDGSQGQESQLINGETECSTSPPRAGNASAHAGKGTTPPDMVGIAVSDAALTTPANQPQNAKQPLRPVTHNMKHTRQPLPAGHPTQPPEQDVRLPICYRFDSPTNAVTKFPAVQVQKHALCVLVKVWLLIAGLYRRASLVDDAHEACQEASKHAARVESLVAGQECSARAFRTRGWGSGKSCDELCADLCTERGLLSKAQSRPHEAMEHFEEALMRYSDHPKATISLANLLLDIWDRKLPLDPPHGEVESGLSKLSLLGETLNENKASGKLRQGSAGSRDDSSKRQSNPEPAPSSEEEPKFLNRLAARERAYGLLSALTKRGSSWDNSEAWFALSRAYEAGDQTKKLREVLWWCIELEDRRPIRHWSNIGSGLYVL